MSRPNRFSGVLYDGFPRMRGDEPYADMYTIGRTVLSPHARG